MRRVISTAALVLGLIAASTVDAAISARLMRYMDVSDDHVAFVYGGDVWLVDRAGGEARQLTHSPGEESWPRFSPDGSEIGFSASYGGNVDVYVMPVAGGVPVRVTHDSHADRMVDWHPDGERLLFASTRASGTQRVSRFFLVDKSGGLPEPLAVPYGELGSFSPDGERLAYVTRLTEDRPFKRYRGGFSSDIYIYDLTDDSVVKVTDSVAIAGRPSWVGDQLFFLSDDDEAMRLNVWVHELGDGSTRRVTDFEAFDVSYLGSNDDTLVFDADNGLFIMDAEALEPREIPVTVVSDLAVEMPRMVDVKDAIRAAAAGPGGKRVVFEARGELFDVPAEEGYSVNLTQSSGAFDRAPAFAPGGSAVAFWSDRSGEYEIHLQTPGSGEAPRQLTDRGEGYGYRLHFSPDGERIAYIDERQVINVVEVESGRRREVADAGYYGYFLTHGARGDYAMAWSPDSRWLAFPQGRPNGRSGISLHDVDSGETHAVTSGYYADANPAFSRDGAYLFFHSDRNLDAVYSDLDRTWVYPNATRIAAIALRPDVPSLLAPRNDAFDAEAEEEEEREEENDGVPEVEIDFEDIEARLQVLPPRAGNFGLLHAFEGRLVYLREPNTGAADEEGDLVYYDFEEREEKTILAGVAVASPTADGEALLVRVKKDWGIVAPEAEQKLETPVPLDGLVMNLVPREEWEQIYADTWRRYRDFFYDPAMHGLDWDAVGAKYGALLDDVRTRWDLARLQFHLLGETSAGHTYVRVGEVEPLEARETGFLGIDWAERGGRYRVGRIVRPAPWESEVRSPLDRPGVDVREGDVIHAVNGTPLLAVRDPYAAFAGLAGRTVSLRVSRDGRERSAREIVVKTLTEDEENLLRKLEWIEGNRRRVDELSGGRLGYVYMTNTADRGQQELVRMFYGQLDREGFVIDERFNGGGQLADRFLELLQRPVVYNLHWRHGRDHTYPVETNRGPVGMLINGWAASGGDGLPWAFQELEAGPIVGENTMGILVGPATGHRLVDGSGITVPGARLYDNDGHWFWEGEGVSPDIEVWDDPSLLAQGRDPQLERLVQELLPLLDAAPAMTPAPPPEDRTARGMRK
ncbi:MAG: PDZ domain-containing protein [Pseudomonadales bacterium]|jgi:tricorn protease|nr:PDZ domain-containing protein [Pseudomonadales bacterium]